jgi:hypothetical protein
LQGGLHDYVHEVVAGPGRVLVAQRGEAVQHRPVAARVLAVGVSRASQDRKAAVELCLDADPADGCLPERTALRSWVAGHTPSVGQPRSQEENSWGQFPVMC